MSAYRDVSGSGGKQRVVSTRTRSRGSQLERPPTPSGSLCKVHGDPEASHLLRPTAGHRDLSRPQPRSLLVGHTHDGEAAEVLLGLDVRTVGEQRRAAGRIDTEHGGSIV